VARSLLTRRYVNHIWCAPLANRAFLPHSTTFCAYFLDVELDCGSCVTLFEHEHVIKYLNNLTMVGEFFILRESSHRVMCEFFILRESSHRVMCFSKHYFAAWSRLVDHIELNSSECT